MNFRCATAADFDELVKIKQLCLSEESKNPRVIIEEFSKINSYCYIAEVNKQIIGYVNIWFTASSGYIASICVLPEYRNIGVGKLLLKEVINESWLRDITEIILHVRISNIAAINFYKSFGFIERGIDFHYYNNDENALIMSIGVQE